MQSRVERSSYRLYDNGRIVGLHSLQECERMVRLQLAEEGLDRDGVTRCFQRTSGSMRARLRQPVLAAPAKAEPMAASADPSNTVFSRAELMALAGRNFKHGRSLTARMTEEQRQNRYNRRGNKLPPEDLVERATNKQNAWQQIGPALQELVREVSCG